METIAVNLSMAGRIRTKEKCPKCDGQFVGKPLSCPKCLTVPKRYFIDYYHGGYGRFRIYTDRLGQPLSSWLHADRVISRIRSEIDERTFDPTKYVKEEIKNFLFERRIEGWLVSKEKGVEKGNLASSYTRNLRNYKDRYYLPFFKGMDVREVRTYTVEQFYEQLPDGLSLKYVKNILDALRNFFATLKRQEYVKDMPSFPHVTVDRKTPKWIDRDTQVKIIENIPERDRPIFLFLAFQGLRPGEAQALQVKDVDLVNGIVMPVRTVCNRRFRDRLKGKVAKPRAINPLIADMLKAQCAGKHPDAYVFTSPVTGRPYVYNRLNDLWRKASTKAGSEITLYEATRHSLASNLLKDGASLKSISDILGHTDIRTTLKYAHGDLDNQRVAFAQQKPIGSVIPLCPQTVPSRKF